MSDHTWSNFTDKSNVMEQMLRLKISEYYQVDVRLEDEWVIDGKQVNKTDFIASENLKIESPEELTSFIEDLERIRDIWEGDKE